MPTDITASAAYTAAPAVPIRSASASATTAQSTASVSSGAGLAPRPSPVSLLDPSTGLVVLEFYDAKGTETESLPTKKQLDSYRLNEPSYSVFQPAIHDATVPSSPASLPGGSTASQGGAAQATSRVAAVAGLASQVGNGSAGSLQTHA